MDRRIWLSFRTSRFIRFYWPVRQNLHSFGRVQQLFDRRLKPKMDFLIRFCKYLLSYRKWSPNGKVSHRNLWRDFFPYYSFHLSGSCRMGLESSRLASGERVPRLRRLCCYPHSWRYFGFSWNYCGGSTLQSLQRSLIPILLP